MLCALVRLLPLAALLLCSVATANNWSYNRVLFEREPNNRPDQAQSFRGAAQLVGELPAGDIDHFWWVFEEEEAGQLWQITLNGDTTSQIRLEMSWPADDDDGGGVMEFGAEPQPTSSESRQLLALEIDPRNPSRSTHDLLIPAGDHLITLSGSGAYEVLFERTAQAGVNRRIRADDDSPYNHNPRLSGYTIEASEVVLALPAGDPDDGLWGLRLTGELDREIEAFVINADGEEMASKRASGLHVDWNALALDAGAELLLRVEDADEIGRMRIEWSAQGQRKSEQRHRAQTAAETRWFEPGQRVLIEGLDQLREHLAFQIDEQQAEQGWHIDLASDQDTPTNVCLHRHGERAAVCREDVQGRLFESITLEPGQYELRLQRSRNHPAGRIEIGLEASERLPSDQVRRPNDVSEWAAPLPAGETLAGNFDVNQRAWFELRVGEPARFWSIEANGSGISRMIVHPGEGGGSLLHADSPTGSDEIRIEQLWLEPGRYRIQLQGRETDYRLLARPQDPPAGQWESEPNENPNQANPLRLNEPMHGTIHASNDQDHFYFELPGWNHLKLAVEPAPGQTLRVDLNWSGQRIFLAQVSQDNPLEFSQYLPPGDYHLAVSGNAVPGQPYRILTELRAPNTPAGPEQSGVSRSMPIQLPPSGEIELRHGVLGLRSQIVALPVADQDREVLFDFTGSRFQMALVDETGEELPIETGEGNQRRIQLAAGQRAWLELRAGNASRTLSFSDPALPTFENSAIRLGLDWSDNAASLAAYRPEAQRVRARLSVQNAGESAETVELASHVSHSGSVLTGLPDHLSLAAGERRQFDLELIVPPMLGSGLALSLYVMSDATAATTTLAIETGRAPLSPRAYQTVPDELVGLADLAWTGLGARFVDEQGETVDERYGNQRVRLQHLIDGMSSGGSTIQWRGGEALPTLVLAGEGGRLHGFVFNQRSSLNPHQRWQRVRIEGATTRGQWQELAEVELESHDGEQFVQLDQAVEARYLRLTPLETWGGIEERGINGTGMFRALGEPLGELAEKRHDLLATELGGHWVYTRPADATPLNFPNVARPPRGGTISRSESFELVYAFLQHRAGYIDRVSWEEDLNHDGAPVEQIQVMTATESPLGPWQDHGLWQLERDADGRAEFRLPEPTPARYLRLVVILPESARDRQLWRWRAPTAIRVFEAHTLASRQSLLGYWGMDDASGPLGPPGGAAAGLEIDDFDSSPNHPQTLEDSVRGQLAQPGDRRSYRIDLAEPDNSLRLRLRESQLGRLRAELIGPDGGPVDLDWQRSDEGWRQAEALGLAPGRYRLDVIEPPRSIVFLWDGSGSIAALQPAIYQALNRFAQGLIPGQEAVNLIPLGGPLLIDGWAEEPRELGRALASYDGRYGSSNSEPYLITASRALQQRDGERVIFLLTDAEVMGRDLTVWNSLERTRPRVMALEISHGSPRDEAETRGYQNLMKAWAHAAGGEYYYTMDRNSLVRSFEAAMDRIRQPSQFELSVERYYAEPPSPGQLKVLSGAWTVVSGGAIHVIFDASGSMLRRMEGGRRIDVARRIVRDVLEQHIPADVPVALRAFGHTEPHSCETELLVQPRDDNRAEVLRAVEGIQAINLARTPLAASLDAVPGDLRGFDQQRQLVLLFTDGEETCDGDVEAAVMALVDSGINVRLNIVGFHIDELELQYEFELLAELAGGEFFDTRDSEGLTTSLVEALAAPFRVYNRHGQSVARGRVDGEPLTLDPGRYRVVVEASGGELEYDIDLAPSSVHQLNLDQE
jgi:hypothetical protein